MKTQITGIIETCLYVKDLKASIGFYKELFEFEILTQDERFCAFSVSGKNVLLLFKQGATNEAATTPGGIIPGHSSEGPAHVGFSIPAEQLSEWKEKLAQHKVSIESTVMWPRGGQSLYFRDLDNHLVELLTPGVWTIY